MPKIKYICKNCEAEYIDMSHGEFDICNGCKIEICMSCGSLIDEKGYCGDCKPLNPNHYDRSVE